MKRIILHASLLLGTLAAGFYLWVLIATVRQGADEVYWSQRGQAPPAHPVFVAFKWPIILGPMVLLLLVRALGKRSSN